MQNKWYMYQNKKNKYCLWINEKQSKLDEEEISLISGNHSDKLHIYVCWNRQHDSFLMIVLVGIENWLSDDILLLFYKGAVFS